MMIADTGSLPAIGGGLGAGLLAAGIPGELTAGILTLKAGALHTASVGADRTRAEASLGNVSVAVSGNGITSEFLMARSSATCLGAAAVDGSSQLATLVINGQSISITGQPNQQIALPNGTLIINEQVPSVVGGSAQLTVNALHVTTRDILTGQQLANVALASATAQIQCQGSFARNLRKLGFVDPVFAQTDPAQFTSGGGWVPGNLGDKATFGFFAAAQSDGTFTGHVVFIDHGPADFSMESTSITAFTPGCTSTIKGKGTSNGSPVDFTAQMHDDGEPGTRDTFRIEATGYANSDPTLGGGNIQADSTWAGGKVLSHRPSCP
jgi:hypothetical protein